jgi:hypothetical protein
MATDDHKASNKNPEAGNNESAKNEDVLDRLPADLKQILEKEQRLLDIDRSQARELLTKGIKAEKKYLDEWGHPSAWSFEGCSEEAQTEANCWFEKAQKKLEKNKEELDQEVAAAQTEINEQLEKIEGVEQDLKTLLDLLKALPEDIEKTKELVKRLRTDHGAASGQMKELIKAELDAAEAKLKLLCCTNDPDSDDCSAGQVDGEPCTPYEDRLHTAIEETLEGWKSEREELLKLVATNEDSLEALQIDIKKIEKKLEYLMRYKKVLLEDYMRSKNLCD